MSTPTSAAAVVKKESVTNGAIAITLRVNNDPASDYVATLYIRSPMTAADIQAWVAEQQAAAVAQYDAVQAAHAAIAAI